MSCWPSRGCWMPGMFAVGGDSHSSMGGAFGCFMAGFGAIEMTGVLVTGEIWIQVPETVRVNWSGRFRARGGGQGHRPVPVSPAGHGEWRAGHRVRRRDRAGHVHVGADGADQHGGRARRGNRPGGGGRRHAAGAPRCGREPAADALSWRSDPGARYAASHDFSATDLLPQVAAPHSPANSGPVGAFGDVRVDQAYIGACVGAKLSDLRHGGRGAQGPDRRPRHAAAGGAGVDRGP